MRFSRIDRTVSRTPTVSPEQIESRKAHSANTRLGPAPTSTTQAWITEQGTGSPPVRKRYPEPEPPVLRDRLRT